jgi:hypothetical protein
VLGRELDRAASAGVAGRRVLLVEGESDRRAVAVLARRLDRDLDREGVATVAIAGATNVRRFVELLGPARHDVPLAGLCDEGEEHLVAEALTVAGIAGGTNRSDLEDCGFFVCVRDLEDELVRALGGDGMRRLVERNGDSRAFRSFQRQPAHRHEPLLEQYWNWLGNHKIRYAPLMVDALEFDRMPQPLRRLLSHI